MTNYTSVSWAVSFCHRKMCICFSHLFHDENVQFWRHASLAALCHSNGAVIHQESWELQRKQGTNVPIEPKSHMMKHSVPLWQVERNPMIIFLFWERLGVCVCTRESYSSKALALHGQSHLTAHLSQTPPLLSCSYSNSPRGPMMVSPCSQQYTATSFSGITAIIYRANRSPLLASWPQQSIKHKSFMSEITAPQQPPPPATLPHSPLRPHTRIHKHTAV